MAGSKLIPSFYAGDTLHIDIETTFNGAPENLTGATIRFIVKAKETDLDADALLLEDYTVPSGADAVAGKASMTVSAVKTGAVPPGPVWFGLIRIIPGSPADVWTIVKEKNKVMQPIGDVA